MNGPWQPFSQMIGGTKMWVVGRQLDVNAPLHGGNVEHYGGYSEDKGVVEGMCIILNRRDKREEKGALE